MDTLKRDTFFLESINVIDYSLILGIHCRAADDKDDDGKTEDDAELEGGP